MTGILQIKNEKYYCVLDFKDDFGKRKRKWVSTGLPVKGNKRIATEMLNKLIAEYEEKESQPKTAEILFTDYLMQWLERKKNKVEITTWSVYHNAVTKHLIPYFKPLNLKIEKLKPKHIADYYDFKFSNGRCDNKKGGLSFASLKKNSEILKDALNQAFLEEIIPRNPALKIPLPKKESIEKRAFLNAAQANELLKIFEGHRLQPIIYTTLYYGLRRGEVVGLKWDAVDFKNDKFEINHTIVQTSIIVAKDKAKTATSMREY